MSGANLPVHEATVAAVTNSGHGFPVLLALLLWPLVGALLLIPLYYQSVRGASALEAGLLLAPQGLGAMITMPLAGRLTDRYGPNRWPACGIPLLVIGIAPFAFVTATTSYVLLCSFGFVLGLGMGLSMMPTMTAAMQAVPPAAIARTSTAMNIIRQSGASIGTAILSVLLATSIAERVSASSVAVKAATLRPSEEKTESVEELSATSLSLWAAPGPIFFTQSPWSRRKSTMPAAGATSSTKDEPAPATSTFTLVPLLRIVKMSA